MKNILMYCHNGSGNHGCEAIIRSTVGIIRRAEDCQFFQISRNPAEDERYGIGNLVHLLPEYSPVPRKGKQFYRAYIRQKLMKTTDAMDTLSRKISFSVPEGNTVSLSIGGDNYCYKEYQLYSEYHRESIEAGHKTILWGCSVEPEALEQGDLLQDLRQFDSILVRESISYEAMRAKGLNNLHLYPDPAFTLEPMANPTVLPPVNTVGINISPMALDYTSERECVVENYVELIRHLLEETDCHIALIPHVVWSYNDDRIVLRKLKNYFPDEERVFLVEDMDCTCLKAYISRLRLFVGARTHATIAAYSTAVPTLVLGYSVKSRGIARDIFGSEEGYVIPVGQLTKKDDLKNAFISIMNREEEIREHLNSFMPGYKARAFDAVAEIQRLWQNNSERLLKTGIPEHSCVGCGACVNRCPKRCLCMRSDREGFLYPVMKRESSCIECGACTKVCPILQEKKKTEPIACYAAKNRDEIVRAKSSSGGVWSILSESVLSNGGVVYGAAFDSSWQVKHIAVENIADLDGIRGAKYSQSYMGSCYATIRKQLLADRQVLFSGTPCQVAGLQSFLGKPYDKLCCVEVICHGVPSPLVWKEYLKSVTDGVHPKFVDFRSKETGWSRYAYSMKITEQNGNVFSERNRDNLYLQGMVRDCFLRPSCSVCHYKGENHPGDIILGDFWGIWDAIPELDDNKGVSAVIANSEKGQKWLLGCMKDMQFVPTKLSVIQKGNPSLVRSAIYGKERRRFYRQFRKHNSVPKAVQEVLQDDSNGLMDYLSELKHKVGRRRHE